MKFADILEQFKKTIGLHGANVQLTPRGSESLGYFEPTQKDVAKRGKTGMGGGSQLLSSLMNRPSQYNSWRDYEKALKSAKPEVKGISENVAKKINKIADEAIPKKQQKTVSQIQKLSPEEIQRYVNKIVSIAGTVDAGLNKYGNFRSPERSTPKKAKANAMFIKDFATQMFQEAPSFGIDPKIITAIHMAESGWGGTRQGNNLGGFGIMGALNEKPTTNLNYKFIAPNMNGAVRQALKAYRKSGYSGITTPQGFAGPGRWNANGWIDPKDPRNPDGTPKIHGDPNWLGNLQSIMGTIYQ